MKLVPESRIRAALGTDDTIDFNLAIVEALETATLFCEQQLRTSFEKTSGRRDDYWLQDPPEVGRSVSRRDITRPLASSNIQINDMLLSRGLVSNVLVRTGDGLEQTRTTGDDITAQCTVDTEKGLVQCPELNLRKAWVSVTYDCGFDPHGIDEDLYNQDQVPSWLKLLAVTHTRILLADHHLFRDTDQPTDTKMLVNERGMQLDRRKRYFPHAARPHLSG